MSTTAFSFSMRWMARRILARSAARLGYVVDGNHVFTAKDYEAIGRGAWRASVSESAGHPTKVVKIAHLLANTYH